MASSYPAQLVSPYYSLQAYNGESSRAPNLFAELDHNNATPPLFKTEVTQPDDRPHFNTANPLYARVADCQPPPHTWVAGVNKIISSLEEAAPPIDQSKPELFESARRANGLQLRAQADKAPHVHYPFTSAKANNGVRKPLFAPSSSSSSSSSPVLGRVSKRPRSLVDAGQNSPPGQQITTKVFHCASIAPRAPGDHRPLIKFYSRRVSNCRPPRFYRRVFLAGPPEKKDAGDKRIFYRREFL